MGTNAEATSRAPTQKTISVTPAGEMAYERFLMAQASDPAGGIADQEVRRGRDGTATSRAVRALQLHQEAEVLRNAQAVLDRVVARTGLPPATIMRSGPTGLLLAARRLVTEPA